MTGQDLLGFERAVSVLSAARSSPPRVVETAIPATLLQYWDSEPPLEIAKLLIWNDRLCREAGYSQILHDDDSARAFLAGLPRHFAEAYDLSPHPAMKCDLFRLCYIAQHGGYYLDADMALRDGFSTLMPLAGNGVVLQWDSAGLEHAPNWFFGFPPGSAVCRLAAEATAQSILAASAKGYDHSIQNILAISGPRLFTRAIATAVVSMPATQRPTVNSVSDAYRHLQNGPQLLKQPLAYKATDRHWLFAAGGKDEPPV